LGNPVTVCIHRIDARAKTLQITDNLSDKIFTFVKIKVAGNFTSGFVSNAKA